MTQDQRILLSAFAAAMSARTPRFREHHRRQFGELLEQMKEMKDAMQKASPKERKAMSDISRENMDQNMEESSLTMDDLQLIVDSPMQFILPAMIRVTPLLYEMDLCVLYTTPDPGFITSDDPFSLWDPDARNRPFPYNSPGLVWDTAEVTLPLSPAQLLYLNRRGISGYLPAPPALLLELNRRTHALAEAHIVANTNETDPSWFILDPRQGE